tara:strand:+ start:31442 stop:32206 length:765 start_codon:yes stop_codon:yes gene_type:complete
MPRKKSKHLKQDQQSELKLTFAKNRQWIWRASIAILIIVCLVWLYTYTHSDKFLPIQHVKIIGQYTAVSKQTIEHTLEPYVSSGFFRTDIHAMQTKLMMIPWIADVDVKKIWPSTLVVELQQQQPIAQWGADGLMNMDGEVYKPQDSATIPENLPQFNAPTEDAKQVFEAYQRMNKMLAVLNLQVVGIDISNRISWRITLSNGIKVMLGRDAIWPRLKRLITVYPLVIGDKANKAISIDMRYPNGVAVKWRKRY